jgi:hypothetical protein
MKELALLTLDEALRLERLQDCNRGNSHAAPKVTRRLPAPSPVSLPSRTREYVLPPELLPGPLSILAERTQFR